MPPGRGAVTERKRISNSEQRSGTQSWTWNCVILLHWFVACSSVAYAFWSYATDKANTSLPKEMRTEFRPSPYGLKRKQDMTSFDWEIERSFVFTTWKWLLVHPLLARATASAAPALLPVFYTGYSALFVTSLLGPEVAAVFLILHALFFFVASMRAPVLCYATAFLVLVLRLSLPDSFRQVSFADLHFVPPF
ncbi:uncharacterized protein LOC144134422 [Amblyomma americanum]